MLSQGFGFVEFKSRDQAVKAWKKLNGAALDGHQLQMNFSRKRIETDPSNRRKTVHVGDSTNKIHVKNIPFQASKKEIRELFLYVVFDMKSNLILILNPIRQFGELRSVRLPVKPGGQGHRGFAFIEYISKDDAEYVVLFTIILALTLFQECIRIALQHKIVWTKTCFGICSR